MPRGRLQPLHEISASRAGARFKCLWRKLRLARVAGRNDCDVVVANTSSVIQPPIGCSGPYSKTYQASRSMRARGSSSATTQLLIAAF